jgi:hypothetical protein
MATSEKERKMLGVPEGAPEPSNPQLAAAMEAAGYTLPKRASRTTMLEAIDNGKLAQRQALKKQVRLQLGVEEEATPEAAAANGTGSRRQVGVKEMRERIGRKGYPGPVPTKREEVEALYASLAQHTIPHSYPTGTRLADVIKKPFTSLAVVPDKGQQVVEVELQAKNTQGVAVAVLAIREKANRRGQFVELAGEPREVAAYTWAATVRIIPDSEWLEAAKAAE